MDPLDVRIPRTMDLLPYGKEPKNPEVFKPSYITERVDRTADTVKARIRGMEEDGVILGYQVLPNLAHLDLASEAHYFEIEGDGDAVVEAALFSRSSTRAAGSTTRSRRG